MAQPIYVKRENHESRSQTITDILERVNSPYTWPQIFIFPEGTCTNGQQLIDFKPGAFYPGHPIQPVTIKYPNKIDTVSNFKCFYHRYVHNFNFEFFTVHMDMVRS